MNKSLTATKFRELDLHDDDFVSVKILAPRTKVNTASVTLEFRDDASQARKIVQFRGCANLRFVIDFDVLADNWFAQTHGTDLRLEAKELARFVRSQKRHWRTTYMPPQHADAPIRRKLASIRAYRLFRITFFGGTLEVLAKGFSLTNSTKSTSKPRG